MKYGNLVKIDIASLRYDRVEMARRCASDRVRQRAESIFQVGIIHPPIVRTATEELLCGYDRVAASIVLKHKKVEVRPVDCTDGEADLIREHENSERRGRGEVPKVDPLKTAQLVSQLEQEEVAASPDVPRTGAHGRTKTARGKALERVAAAAGVTSRQIRRREQRAKEILGAPLPQDADASSVQDEPARDDPPPPKDDAEDIVQVRIYGMTPEASFREGVVAQRKHVRASIAHLRVAMAALKPLERHEYPPATLARLRKQISELSSAIKAAMPDGLCPYCKNHLALPKSCKSCEGTGVGLAGIIDGAPPELTAADSQKVIYRGRVVDLAVKIGDE